MLISYAMFVSLSAYNNFRTSEDFHETWLQGAFLTSDSKLQVWLKWDYSNWHFKGDVQVRLHSSPVHLVHNSLYVCERNCFERIL
jgi:hypothetical protein